MPYKDNFTNDIYQDEHDEEMTRKHPNYYKAIKTFFPEAYKLPEEEITPMIGIMKNKGNTYEDAVIHVQNYIKEKQNDWNQNYFKDEFENKVSRDIKYNFKRTGHAAYNFINNISPTFAALDTAGILYDTKKQMERSNLINGDNYYHRLGMCEVGKRGNQNIFYPAAGFFAGSLKEIKDIYNKSIKGDMPWLESLADSKKDILNNWEGLTYGLNNANKECKVWLQDLDYYTNMWKK